LDAQQCFESRLQSTLIQTAALTLYQSDYCASMLSARQLGDVLV
jgi:hypothetical protein